MLGKQRHSKIVQRRRLRESGKVMNLEYETRTIQAERKHGGNYIATLSDRADLIVLNAPRKS